MVKEWKLTSEALLFNSNCQGNDLVDSVKEAVSHLKCKLVKAVWMPLS